MNIISRKTAMASAIGAVALALLAPIAQASDVTTSPYLFGDWNGNRTALAEKGVKFNFAYASEIASNSTGGSKETTRYSDQWVLGSDLDLDKLWGWKGSSFNLTITNRNGHNLSDDAHLGTFQQVQEVYGRGQTWRLTNMSFEQKLLNDQLSLKFGRLNIGSDFAGFSCDFQNLNFCGSQPGNIVGSYWGNWPVSVWAGVAKYNTSADTYVKVGVYQVNPSYFADNYARHRGMYPNNPHGTTGALIPVEAAYMPAIKGLPGSYKVGAWYNTSDTADLLLDQNRAPLGSTSVGALQRDGAYGAYINFQQQVTGVAGGKGTTVFLNASQADKFTAATDSQIALGAQFKGYFNRANDVIGVAVGATHGNARRAAVRNGGYEVASEVYYAWTPIPSITIRPNVQFIKHPGGTAQNSDVVVFGLKSSIAF